MRLLLLPLLAALVGSASALTTSEALPLPEPGRLSTAGAGPRALLLTSFDGRQISVVVPGQPARTAQAATDRLWYPQTGSDGTVRALELDFQRCTIDVWNIGSGRVVGRLQGEIGQMLPCRREYGGSFSFSASFSADGTLLYTADPSGLRVWNVADGRLLRRQPGASAMVRSLPGRGVLRLTTNEPRVLELWTSGLDRVVRRLPLPRECLRAMSPQVGAAGDRVALPCANEVQVWNVRTGAMIRLPRLPMPYELPEPAPLLRGDLVALDEGRRVTVWNLTGARAVIPLPENDRTTGVAFAPGGELFILSQRGALTRHRPADGYRLRDQETVYPFGEQPRTGLSLAVLEGSAGAQVVVASGADRVARLYNLR